MEVAHGVLLVFLQVAAVGCLTAIAWSRASDLGQHMREQDEREAEFLRRTRVEIEA
ncbi:hypothetical protein [Lysobacter sp. FW306-1B-D06B]|uniref:hypothetical protein n=1 Tax=Lysobacter sp. FW306-1B-D06B TaxID=3140250 RepID=UPI00313FF1D1